MRFLSTKYYLYDLLLNLELFKMVYLYSKKLVLIRNLDKLILELETVATQNQTRVNELFCNSSLSKISFTDTHRPNSISLSVCQRCKTISVKYLVWVCIKYYVHRQKWGAERRLIISDWWWSFPYPVYYKLQKENVLMDCQYMDV